MKILVAGFASPDSFADNVAHALRQMGHEAFLAPASLAPGSIARLVDRVREQIAPASHSRVESWILQSARSLRPEMLIAPTQGVSEEVLSEVRRCGVKHSVAWWADSPGNLRGMNLLSNLWSLVCLKDRSGVAKLRRVGVNAEYLLEAMNPSWHRVVSGCRNDRVAIAGNFYGYRQYLVKVLAKKGVTFDLFGGSPPRWAVEEVRRFYRGRYVVREEKSRVFGEALACLNSTSFIEGSSLNCRAFEVAGAGGLQIIEQRDCIEEGFEPGKEILVFDGVDAVLSHLDWARRAPLEAERVRQAAARRALAEHTYEHRLRQIFSWLELRAG